MPHIPHAGVSHAKRSRLYLNNVKKEEENEERFSVLKVDYLNRNLFMKTSMDNDIFLYEFRFYVAGNINVF